MNSRQLNFFTLAEDIFSISEFFKEGGCQIFKRHSPTGRPELTYDIVRNEENVVQVYISAGKFLNKIYYHELESKNIFYIDIGKSYCIEFSIGGIYPYSNKQHHSGRLYYISAYFENGRKVHKSDEFTEWAENILEGFKKQFLKHMPGHVGDYVSEKFADWVIKNHATVSNDGTKYIID
jgi:hypothetical protein